MAGTITSSRIQADYSKSGCYNRCEIVTVDWVGDASTGAVPTLALDLRGWCIKAITNPGSTAPTANYDIALADPEDSALDALGTALQNRHTTSTEQVYPAIAGSPGTVTAYPPYLNGSYTVTITNNSVNSATGRIILYLVDHM